MPTHKHRQTPHQPPGGHRPIWAHQACASDPRGCQLQVSRVGSFARGPRALPTVWDKSRIRSGLSR
eukprot:4043920-Alexandrium_andersonii.AAC.1